MYVCQLTFLETWPLTITGNNDKRGCIQAERQGLMDLRPVSDPRTAPASWGHTGH